MAPTRVLAVGDTQYESATLDEYQKSYALSWGRFKSFTRPSTGNKEYETTNASGYFSYFGSAAGDPSKGYYSFDVGSWHVVALNTECGFVGGCAVGSPQEKWLRADLQAHPNACTLAFGHRPRWSSGGVGDATAIDALWRAFAELEGDVWIAGHSHNYERFAPQDASGGRDTAQGIREFVVGTGGKSLVGFSAQKANSEFRYSQNFGVLRLTLGTGSYSWQFVSIAGTTVDSGTGSCH